VQRAGNQSPREIGDAIKVKGKGLVGFAFRQVRAEMPPPGSVELLLITDFIKNNSSIGELACAASSRLFRESQ
jgi:hypothetical protein